MVRVLEVILLFLYLARPEQFWLKCCLLASVLVCLDWLVLFQMSISDLIESQFSHGLAEAVFEADQADPDFSDQVRSCFWTTESEPEPEKEEVMNIRICSPTVLESCSPTVVDAESEVEEDPWLAELRIQSQEEKEQREAQLRNMNCFEEMNQDQDPLAKWRVHPKVWEEEMGKWRLEQELIMQEKEEHMKENARNISFSRGLTYETKKIVEMGEKKGGKGDGEIRRRAEQVKAGSGDAREKEFRPAVRRRRGGREEEEEGAERENLDSRDEEKMAREVEEEGGRGVEGRGGGGGFLCPIAAYAPCIQACMAECQLAFARGIIK